MKQSAYFIHGWSVGLDLTPVQMELYIERSEARRSAFKWNVAHLKGEFRAKSSEKWISLLEKRILSLQT